MAHEQPGDFGFGEDEAMLRDSARKFFADKLSANQLHQLVASNHNPHRENGCLWDRDLWQQVVELGWLAVCIPESAGGIGMPLVAAVALAEEAGHAAYPSPLLSTFNAVFVLRYCNTAPAAAALSEIATGTTATLAVTNAKGSLEPEDTDITVDDQGRLTGSAHFVQDARKAELFVVSARGNTGVGLYLVRTGDSGVDCVADNIVDLTRDQAHLQLDRSQAIELAAPGTGGKALAAALPALLCIASADMVGAGEWLLQTTVDYANTRVQFERPLGFFQAVKHPLVNVMMDIDGAKSLTYNAACAVDLDAGNALTLARMAKAQASDMAVFSASRAIQFHGGIGFTWESNLQLFFKRQTHSQTLLGDARYHRAKLADALIDRPQSPEHIQKRRTA